MHSGLFLVRPRYASMELNPFQDRAVKTQGHCTILACPGSGKTRVLSTRAAYLIGNHELGRLCAVTFTRDAANELMDRILDSCGKENARRLAVGTFHSLAMAQIKRNSKGRPAKLLGDGDRMALVRRCWRENAPDMKLDDVVKAIDTAKARVQPVAFADIAMQRVYSSYEEILKSEHVMDFSDLLLTAVRGMQSGEIAPLPIKWLLVDEAQDMDEVQLEWILAHGRAGVEVTLVGDDDQSLYSFRHALGYAGLQEASVALGSIDLTLPVNYRCAPNILEHAAKLIGKNTNRAPKNIQAAKTEAGEIIVHRLPTRDDEGAILANTIGQDLKSQWAVLGRTNTLLDTVEVALSTNGIPYKRLGGKSIWDQAIGGVFSGLLRSIADNSWTGVANALAFCNVDAAWINDHSRSSSGGCVDRMDMALGEAQDERRRKVLVSLREGFVSWEDQAFKGRTSLVVHGVAGFLTPHCKPPQAALLKSLADSFCRLNGTLAQRLAMLSRTTKDKSADAGVVQIITLHSSKGLEFEHVWIMGSEEGNLPHTDSTEEEERRLMYVGMTRAKRKLVISGALSEGLESRFLEESGL